MNLCRSRNDSAKNTLGNRLFVHDDGEATITGGTIGNDLGAYDSTNITMSGGFIGDTIFAGIDDGYGSGSDAIITLIGSDFAVDGNPFGYGELYSINGGQWDGEPVRHLSGVLANGDPIDNDFYIGYDAKIVLVPEPTTLLLLGLGVVMLRRKHS